MEAVVNTSLIERYLDNSVREYLSVFFSDKSQASAILATVSKQERAERQYFLSEVLEGLVIIAEEVGFLPDCATIELVSKLVPSSINDSIFDQLLKICLSLNNADALTNKIMIIVSSADPRFVSLPNHIKHISKLPSKTLRSLLDGISEISNETVDALIQMSLIDRRHSVVVFRSLLTICSTSQLANNNKIVNIISTDLELVLFINRLSAAIESETCELLKAKVSDLIAIAKLKTDQSDNVVHISFG